VARELLNQPDGGADPYATPVIRQRRQGAAKACLDVLWAMMSEYNAQEGKPSLTPGLIQFSPRKSNVDFVACLDDQPLPR
jgi:hypothetical protein